MSKKSNEAWPGNLGGVPKYANRPEGQRLIWIHAASVGEVISIVPVLKELRRLIPDSILVLTTITQTGHGVALKAAKVVDAVGYFPLDFPFIVKRVLDRMRPDVFVTVEVELWPNLLAAAKQKGVRCMLINGRISDRSIRQVRWWGWVLSWMLSRLDYCLMQTGTDAERVVRFGVPLERVSITGSTKFDQDGGRIEESVVRELRSSLGLQIGDRVIVAGSTNPGEEEVVLNAFRKMKDALGDLKLIIAPRQIDRAEEIKRLAKSRDFACTLRTSQAEDYDVLVLDSFGELARVYAVAEIAFVGGTLIPKGGHSLIQPIVQGKPVLFGPYTFKTRDIAQTAIRTGVGFKVENADALAAAAVDLVNDAERRRRIDEACRRLVAENKGASSRCAELIAKVAGRTEQE